ncbi:MAG: T9SS type A sorting domain-containing protein [Bacteroidales bacterium]|jgi:hypothetical protein|nr:T9SS type A sorting domain-containing protein [Bacteroidales bacterium]
MKIRKILLMTVFALSSLSMLAQNTEWLKLGPENIGGRVRSIVFDRFNGDVMYAGGVAGGFFISVNNGRNWEEIQLGNADNSSIAVTAICQSDDGTVYVGTGESYYNAISYPGTNNNVTSLLGNGVYKLENWSSANWTASLTTDEAKYAYAKTNMHFVSLTSTQPAKYDKSHEWAYVNDMVCVGNTVYAGLAWKLKYSTDGGATWQNATVAGSTTNPIFIGDIKANKDGRVAIAYGIAGGTTGGGNVSDYKVAINSIDNPTTFTNILTKTDLNTDLTSLGRIEIAFGMKDPNTLYAAVGDAETGGTAANTILNGVFRTRDLDTHVWTRAAATSEWAKFGVDLVTSFSIFVDDRGPYEQIYVGASNLFSGYDNNDTEGTGLYLWSQETASSVSRSSAVWVAENIHNIIVKENPQNEADSLMMVLATDGGVFIYAKTTPYDPTKPDYCWQLSTKGMNTVQFYDVAVTADGSVVGAAQSNAIVYIPKSQDEVFVNTDEETIWMQVNNDTVVVNGVKYFSFNSDNYSINIDGNTLTIRYKANTNGDVIWSPNSDGYTESGAYNGTYDFSGSAVVASGFEKIAPNYIKPLVVARPNTTIARTYSNHNSYYEVNTTTWNFGTGTLQLMPVYLAPNNYDPANTPMFLWESTNATTIPDSAKVIIDIHSIINGSIGGTSSGEEWKPGAWIMAGDSILVKSPAYPLSYPFYYTLPNNIQLTDSSTVFNIQNPIQSRLFVAASGGVYVCSDILNFTKYVMDGGSVDYSNDLIWAKVYTLSTPQSSKVHCLSVSGDGNALFIAIEDGSSSILVRVTGLLAAHLTDHDLATGAHYNLPAMGLPNPLAIDTIATFSRFITSLATDRVNANNLIVTFGDYGTSASVMLSTNALAAGTSATFTNITGIDPETANPIPATKPVFASVIESMSLGNPHTAYIGAEDGIWKTTDFTSNPVNWVRMSGVPNVPVYKLVQQTSNLPYMENFDYNGNVQTTNKFCATVAPGAIYAATYGKGIFAYFGDTVAQKDPVVSLPNINVPLAGNGITLSIAPNPTQNETNITYFVPSETKVAFKLYDINGRLVSTIERGSHRAGSYSLPLNCQGLKKGIYMVQIITKEATSTAKLVVQ